MRENPSGLGFSKGWQQSRSSVRRRRLCPRPTTAARRRRSRCTSTRLGICRTSRLKNMPSLLCIMCRGAPCPLTRGFPLRSRTHRPQKTEEGQQSDPRSHVGVIAQKTVFRKLWGKKTAIEATLYPKGFYGSFYKLIFEQFHGLTTSMHCKTVCWKHPERCGQLAMTSMRHALATREIRIYCPKCGVEIGKAFFKRFR